MGQRRQDDLDLSVQTLIDLDEPEALLATLQGLARRRTGERWHALAEQLKKAEVALNYRSQPGRDRETSQPEPQELTHGKHPDAAAPEAAAATPAPEAPAA